MSWVELAVAPVETGALRDGARALMPAAPAIAVWGLVTGVAMVDSGLPTRWAVLMTLVVFAGSAQLATLPLIVEGAPPAVIWITALLVNLRFVIFSAAGRQYFRQLSIGQRLCAGYINGDLGFALFIRRFDAEGERGSPYQWGYFYGLAAVNWVVWQVASLVGIFAAGWADSEWGLELAAVLALVAVVLPMLHNAPAVIGVAVAAAVSVLGVGLPVRLGLPLAVVCGVAVSFAVESTPLGRLVLGERG